MLRNKIDRQWWWVAIVLAVALLLAIFLIVFKPTAERKPVDIKHPSVDVIWAKSEWQSIPVVSQGRIEAARRIELAAEVSGRIVRVAENTDDGSFFSKDDELFKIDPREYQLAVVRAEAQVAAAEQNLIRAQAEAQQAKQDLGRLSNHSLDKPTAYALREPQLKEAQARLKAAKADYELAQLKLEKTSVRAGFSGRVIKKKVSAGQYVTTATSLIEIYDDEYFHIKLPIRLSQLPLIFGKENSHTHTIEKNINIELYLALPTSTKKYTATLKQVAAEVDKDNQLIKLLAIIKKNVNEFDTHLLPGTYVRAKIISAEQQKIFSLPRQALRSNTEIWLLDKASKLRKRRINVLYKNESHIFINKGITDGEAIIVSSLDSPIEGMQLDYSKRISE